jgi:hypothetical protein
MQADGCKRRCFSTVIGRHNEAATSVSFSMVVDITRLPIQAFLKPNTMPGTWSDRHHVSFYPLLR